MYLKTYKISSLKNYFLISSQLFPDFALKIRVNSFTHSLSVLYGVLWYCPVSPTLPQHVKSKYKSLLLCFIIYKNKEKKNQTHFKILHVTKLVIINAQNQK